VLARHGRLIEQHERLLSAHHAPVVAAPLSVWWAAGSCPHGRPPTAWSKTTSGRVEVRVVEGHHYTILRPPAVSAIAAGLAATGAEEAQPAQT
jgi:thioesterase domain-containing protein